MNLNVRLFAGPALAFGCVACGGAGVHPASPPFELTVPVAPQLASFETGRALVFEVLIRNTGTETLTLSEMTFEGGPFVWAAPDVCAELQRYPEVDAETLPELRVLHDVMAETASLPPCTIAPHHAAFVPIWATAPTDAEVPTHIHLHARFREVANAAEVNVPALLAEPTLTLGPPLRSGPWLVMNGLSRTAGHRATALQMHGAPHWAQRFAADIMKLDEAGCAIPEGASFTENARFFGYGQDVLAVADARVARVLEGVPENVPGAESRAVPINVTTVTGNAVWLDLGENRFAFYAHLRPGSIRVHEGDVVHRGDVLGSLGNSGNSTAPHLHFHVARGLGGLETEGVPYTFEHFTTQSFTEVAEDPRCVRLGDDARVLTELLPSEGTAIRFE